MIQIRFLLILKGRPQVDLVCNEDNGYGTAIRKENFVKDFLPPF